MVRAGESAYVGGQGDVNFGTVPPTVVTPGGVTRVSLVTNAFGAFGPMPTGTFGTKVSVAADGKLYAFVYADATTFRDGRCASRRATSPTSARSRPAPAS